MLERRHYKCVSTCVTSQHIQWQGMPKLRAHRNKFVVI